MVATGEMILTCAVRTQPMIEIRSTLCIHGPVRVGPVRVRRRRSIVQWNKRRGRKLNAMQNRTEQKEGKGKGREGRKGRRATRSPLFLVNRTFNACVPYKRHRGWSRASSVGWSVAWTANIPLRLGDELRLNFMAKNQMSSSWIW